MPLPRNDCDAMVDPRALEVAPGDHRHAESSDLMAGKVNPAPEDNVGHPPRPASDSSHDRDASHHFENHLIEAMAPLSSSPSNVWGSELTSFEDVVRSRGSKPRRYR